MKNVLIITFLLFLASNIKSQSNSKNYELIWIDGSPINSLSISDYGGLINEDGEMHRLRIKRETLYNSFKEVPYVYETINSNFKKTKSEEIEFESNEKGNFICYGGFKLKNSFISIYQGGTLSKASIIVQEFLLNGKVNKSKTILEYEPVLSLKGDYVCKFLVSNDQTKLLSIFSHPDKTSKNASYNIMVLDESLNQIWNKKVSIPYPANKFSVADVAIDNNGCVYLIAKIDETNKNKKMNYSFKIFSFSNNGELTSEYPINHPDKILLFPFLKVDDNNNLICIGHFSQMKKTSNCGLFSTIINTKTNEQSPISFSFYDEAFLTQRLIAKDSLKIAKKTIEDREIEEGFVIEKMITLGNNDKYLIGRHGFFLNTQVSFSNLIQINSDLIVSYLKADGNIKWLKRIPINQDGSYPNYDAIGYSTILHNNNLYLFFNDSYRNINYSGRGSCANFFTNEYGIGVLTQFNSDGNVKRDVIFDGRDKKIFLQPKSLTQLNKDEYLLMGISDKKEKYLKLRFLDN